MVEFYNVVDKDYINLCKQQVLDVRIKVELLDHYEHTIGEVTTKVSSTSGSISVKYNQGVRRTCDITIDDINKKMLPNNENSVFFVNKKFKIYIGLYKKNWSKSGSDGTGVYHNSQDDTIYWFSQGIFITQNCDYDKKNGVLHLSGVDKFGFFTKDLNQHTLQNTYHISADSKLGQLISDIITIDMGNGMPTDTQTPIIHTSFVDQVLPYDIEKTANETIGDILVEIATAFNADIYYDVDGHLVFEPNIIDDYNRQAPVFEFGKNDSALIDMALDFNYGDIVNQITVTGDNSDGVVYSSTATNENPVSSLRVSNIGIKAADIEETAMGYSDKRCSDYANYLLKKKMRMAIAGTITCTPLPHLDCNRVIKVYQNEEDVNEVDFLIEEIQIPLSPEAYSLSVCNIQDLPLTCYTSKIPPNNLSEWVFFKGSNTIGKYVNRGGETFVVAPAYVDGRTITTLGGTGKLDDGETITADTAMGIKYLSPIVKGLSSTKTLYIENGIKNIKDGAFATYENLTNVIMPNSIITIGNNTFQDCTNLVSIIIPNSVTSIGSWAFNGCLKLNNITLSSNLTTIEYSAFYGCTSLTDITVPYGVTTIRSQVFYNCTNLSNITIPDSVISIEYNAFYNTALLNNQTGVKYAGTWVIGCDKDVISAEIKNGVKGIAGRAFYKCTNLTNILLPDTMVTIGETSFYGCTGLTDITLPVSVTLINSISFSNCTSLASITIKNPDCEIYDDKDTINSTATIYGFENSTAQEYAEKYNRTFVAITETE